CSEKKTYQESTRRSAENLENILQKKFRFKGDIGFLLLSDVGSSDEIRRDLEAQLKKGRLLYDVNSIHLNYTGGTKVMGTHVYRFVEMNFGTYPRKKSFSYFDGRRFQLMSDGDCKLPKYDLRKESKISIDNIIDLHDFHKKSNREDDAFTNVLDYMKEEGNVTRLSSAIVSLRDDYGYVRKRNKGWEDLAESANGILADCLKKMPPALYFFDDAGNFDPVKPQTLTLSHSKKLYNFLNGIWLEQYIHHLVNTSDLDAETDLKINKSDWLSYFQLDVAARNGFQLIGVSCTVSEDKGTCKHKGFEIIHRIRQIGGDEAKAMVVTLATENTRKNVEAELLKDAGCPEGYIKVLGRDDLDKETFYGKLKDFIQ
ncbi:MAG: hypothetical protein GY765_11340, partial [bacterium]|nr:hypothetical protein [bacterium]